MVYDKNFKNLVHHLRSQGPGFTFRNRISGNLSTAAWSSHLGMHAYSFRSRPRHRRLGLLQPGQCPTCSFSSTVDLPSPVLGARPSRTMFSGLAASGYSLSRYPTGCGPADSHVSEADSAWCQPRGGTHSDIPCRSTVSWRHWFASPSMEERSLVAPPCNPTTMVWSRPDRSASLRRSGRLSYQHAVNYEFGGQGGRAGSQRPPPASRVRL